MFLLSHSQGINTIDCGYLRRGMAASHLLVEKGHAAFIDTGTSLSFDNQMQALALKGIDAAQVDYVIATHVHLDHAGGAGRLLQELPNARLVVHPRGAAHMIDPSKLIAGARAVYGAEKMCTLYGDIIPVAAERIIQADDGFILDFQGRPLICVDTPGHARHHLAVVDERSHSIFTGDAFGISYREFDTSQGAFIFPSTTPVQLEPEAMHASFDTLMRYHPKQIYLTHFGEVRNPTKLVRDLHVRLDTFLTITADMASKHKTRHYLIVESMGKLLYQELKEHGCTLSEAECRRLLDHDLELNAQGLELWWDKHHA
jgi:glyoxylase-like metal-dependent hydrolase (beta-lactamase superfamily II)